MIQNLHKHNSSENEVTQGTVNKWRNHILIHRDLAPKRDLMPGFPLIHLLYAPELQLQDIIKLPLTLQSPPAGKEVTRVMMENLTS